MKFIEVPKKSREEWLQWRHNGIGSSDVPVIMGVSRYKTYDELLSEKIKPSAIEDTSNGYIKDRGNRIELVVRKLYEEHMGIDFPPMSVESVHTPYLKATLDGVDDGMNLICEIKLLSSQNPDKVNIESEGYKKWLAAKWGKVIPEDYYPQIQHQLAITGTPVCVFLGLREIRQRMITLDDIVMVSVEPDEKYIKDMLNKTQIFWEKVIEGKNENKS